MSLGIVGAVVRQGISQGGTPATLHPVAGIAFTRGASP
jgi:hypothetical protein